MQVAPTTTKLQAVEIKDAVIIPPHSITAVDFLQKSANIRTQESDSAHVASY